MVITFFQLFIEIGVYGSFLDVFGNAGDKAVAIFEVSIEIGLVYDTTGLSLDARLFIRQR